jgi:hypothetical protein
VCEGRSREREGADLALARGGAWPRETASGWRPSAPQSLSLQGFLPQGSKVRWLRSNPLGQQAHLPWRTPEREEDFSLL